MKLTSIIANLLLAASASAKIYYAGVAEAGGEFGVYSSTATPGTGLPGTFGVDYAFLNASTVNIWINENKINLFRIAFLLERMCPLGYGLGSKFNETHFQYYKEAIEAVTSAGGYAILDPHNYMRYGDPSQQPMTGPIIGDTANPNASTTAQFQEFWQELATRFANNTNVIFSIMNEVRTQTLVISLFADMSSHMT